MQVWVGPETLFATSSRLRLLTEPHLESRCHRPRLPVCSGGSRGTWLRSGHAWTGARDGSSRSPGDAGLPLFCLQPPVLSPEAPRHGPALCPAPACSLCSSSWGPPGKASLLCPPCSPASEPPEAHPHHDDPSPFALTGQPPGLQVVCLVFGVCVCVHTCVCVCVRACAPPGVCRTGTQRQG